MFETPKMKEFLATAAVIGLMIFLLYFFPSPNQVWTWGMHLRNALCW